jgi:8-amino-7-oxononanoate synthase
MKARGAMIDFTSSLYLGLRHASRSLRPWAQLTTGVPAVLRTPSLSRTIAAALAALTGTERATLCRSTLHAFWDLFPVLVRPDTTIYVDASAYPIARWGVERVACRGIPVRTFRHHDPADLSDLMVHDARMRTRPLIVADGFCTGCGCLAPIHDYLAQARSSGGMLALDDTQALGVFGRSRGVSRPYGFGGGGSLQVHEVTDPHVVLVSSMAKGLGVPMAMVAGSRRFVADFEQLSATQVHSSPPSYADLHAAESALTLNRSVGDAIRWRLAMTIGRFRRQLHTAGIQVGPSLFPVQSLRLPWNIDAVFCSDGCATWECLRCCISPPADLARS